MYKCDICGKFRKLKDLVRRHTPDTHFTSEDSWSERKKCIKPKKKKLQR